MENPPKKFLNTKPIAMTYRDAIQIQIAALQQIYDHAEGLRDVANEDEKDAWNNVRRLLPEVWRPLQKMDNKLSDSEASYKLKGDYSINITTETV
jgi:hypothetical protein